MRKSFTLIELMVVISIIGLLMAITVVMITYYRNKAIDARIGSSLAEARKVAQLVANEEFSYLSICDADHTLNQSNSSLKAVEDDVRNFNNENPSCYAIDSQYCIQTKLVSGGYFCVDNMGTASQNANCSGTNISCQ